MTIGSLNQTFDRAEIFQSLNPVEAPGPERAQTLEELGASEFMELMIAQMQNQDPTSPMDNMQFMSQLAQFSTVGGIQELNESFDGLSGNLSSAQALQASSMIGRSVSTGSNVGSLSLLGYTAEGEAVNGMQASVDMGAGASGGQFFVKDASGNLVYRGSLPAGSGTQVVTWDGRSDSGNPLPPGQYSISAETFFGGQTQSAQVFAHEQVTSVSIGNGSQVTLNLANGQSVNVVDVKEFF